VERYGVSMFSGQLRKLLDLFPHEDQGWKQLDETFIRYQIVKTPWFRIYVHKLIAPMAHPHCHDHPWSFVTILLKGGYFEMSPDTRGAWVWRKPGSVMYRPHNWLHNVATFGTSWSLVITGPKKYEWGFKHCGE
jgi:hypothetical protein